MRAVRRRDLSTFGAVGDEPKGDDLYIVKRDVTASDNLGGPAELLFRPISIFRCGAILFYVILSVFS